MSVAQVVTVGAAHVVAGEDTAARLVVQALLAEGLPVVSRQIVDDDEASVEATLAAALARPGLVVILASPGGSGGEVVPRVLSRLAGTRLILSERVLQILEQGYVARGGAVPRRKDRLALLPQGAQIWQAPGGVEPGWVLGADQAVVAVLPDGSPALPAFLELHLRPLARERFGVGEVKLLRTLKVAGLGAAEVEERLGRWLGRDGQVSVSTIPVEGDVWIRVTSRGATRSMAAAVLERVLDRLEAALGPDCYGRDDDVMEAVVGRLLLERDLGLSVAESCTGGLLGHRITGVPGSSRYFERGVLVYSNAAKQELLGVDESLLRAHGAVSEAVAEAMVRGAARLGRTACGLAVTGIAGPEGGTPEKPVGTVCIGALWPDGLRVRRFRFAGGRDAVKWQSTQAALDTLRRGLLEARRVQPKGLEPSRPSP
jgi:nicotinamide-nucleotide amidase